ncbi:ribonuclease P protein subunit p29 [Biomphalaria pfeifferi]|uniref:Ribonuclease P protein subunit p29 n=1 Tax=Biomphalaria pfeifferi TaxID=112525 RepID=A0AAD8EYW0_BIOPF|nr:ribonuclease P protein subunit p29 [Biomphalaria pfeifferi]
MTLSASVSSKGKDNLYSELTYEDAGEKWHTTGKEAKSSWFSSFTNTNLPAEKLQPDSDLSSKFESIQSGKKRKRRKLKTKEQKKQHYLARLEKRRKRRLFLLPTVAKYSDFVPLRDMWIKYIEDLLNFSSLNSPNLSSAAQKLMKADFHGCPITVEQSTCPGHVGLQGIVITETQNTFSVVLPNDTVRCIPKCNNIFSFVLHHHVFTIYGNHLKVKPGERSGKKFKSKPTIDM